MTLLTICQDAAREIGIDVPSTIVGNTDPDAARLLRYAKKVGYALFKKYDWQELIVGASFTATAGYSQGDWTPGVTTTPFNEVFARFVPETMWDVSNNRLISGPVQHSRDIGFIGLDISTGSAPRYFSFRGRQLRFFPGASGGETINYLYVANYWANTYASQESTFTADTNTPLLDEELITLGVIYEFLRGRGLPFAEAKADYDDMYETLVAEDQSRRPQILTAGDLWNDGRHFDGQPPVTLPSGDLF